MSERGSLPIDETDPSGATLYAGPQKKSGPPPGDVVGDSRPQYKVVPKPGSPGMGVMAPADAPDPPRGFAMRDEPSGHTRFGYGYGSAPPEGNPQRLSPIWSAVGSILDKPAYTPSPEEISRGAYQQPFTYNPYLLPPRRTMVNPGGRPAPEYAPVPTTMSGDIANIAQQVRQRDNPEDMFTPQENFQRNQGWAKPGPYQTQLSPQEEAQFQQWAHQQGVRTEDYTGPQAVYDMRGFWKAQQVGDPRAVARPNPNDLDEASNPRIHYPDIWKTPYAATFSNESQYALPNAPHWGREHGGGDVYRMPDGTVIFNDFTGRWYGVPGS